MIKALFKKQILEIGTFLFRDKKTGQMRGKKSAVLAATGFFALIVLLGFSFAMMLLGMTALLETEWSWLYFTLAGLLAIVFGVFGSVFNTYAGLYHAKDNDFLLSMPIPPRKILLVRVAGVALMGAIYSSTILVPAVILLIVCGHPGALTVVIDLLLIPLVWLIVTALSSLLGWVVALLSGFLKNRKWIVAALSILILLGYFRLVSGASDWILSLVQNPETVGLSLKNWAYPFYQLGRASVGDGTQFLLFVAEVAAFSALVWLFLTRTFSSITSKSGVASSGAKYKEKTARQASLLPALLRKEGKRFTGSATYMMNCGIGAVLLPLAGIILLTKSGDVSGMLAQIGDYSFLLPIAVAAVGFFASSIFDVSAPSVSLEGKTIWLLQVMPVPAQKALRAKELFHILLAGLPTLFLTFCACGVLKLSPLQWLLCSLLTISFVILTAVFGLAANLKFPNLQWTSETTPVKQSLPVFFSLFGGWIYSILLGVGGFFLAQVIGADGTLALMLVPVLLPAFLLDRWIMSRGAEIFASL